MTGSKKDRWDISTTDCGIIKMKLPGLNKATRDFYQRFPKERNIPWIDVAIDLFKVAMHECGHILDYQMGGKATLPWSTQAPAYRRGGRRQNHDDRPEEIRAERYTTDAIPNIGPAEVEAILTMAIWLEDNQGF